MNEGWTVDDSIAEFEGTGMPVEEYRFRKAIQAFQIRPVGEEPSGELGGRGRAMYDIDDMQALHADFIRWRERQARHAGRRER
jgi:hypothetical protein